MNCLTKKISFISGATSGLGKELSIHLAKNGYHVLIHGRNQQLQSQKMDSLTEIESLQSKITLLEAQLEQSVEIGQESSLLKDSVDSYKDVIKKLRSEHRILKTNSVNEITRYKAEVEILKERVEILESTDSSRMLEEQLKLEKTAHSSNILALKTKMENQGKEIEKLISNQETIKELYESEKTAASELVEEKLRDKNEMAKFGEVC